MQREDGKEAVVLFHVIVFEKDKVIHSEKLYPDHLMKEKSLVSVAEEKRKNSLKKLQMKRRT